MDLRGERVIAAARLALALATLGTLLQGFETLEEFKKAAPIAAGLFAAYSLGIFFWFLAAKRVSPWGGGLLLCADLVWFSTLIFVGGFFVEDIGSNPYPILYVFILLAAGLRWGMRETLVCAGICSMFSVLFPVAMSQVQFKPPFLTGPLHFSQFDFNAILMRTVALLVVGYLIGYLAEREKRVKRGMSQLAQALSGARVDHDLSEVVGLALAGIRDLYKATSVTALFYDFDEEDLVRCALPPGMDTPEISEVPHLELGAWIDLENPQVLPPTLPGHLGSARFHWTHFRYQGHLGWLFVVDPAVKSSSDFDSLQQVADQLGPVLDKMFLLRRVRKETIEEERSRLARDFHDGPLQSFYSFELYLEVLQHWLERDPERAAQELASLRDAAHRQGLELREFVQNMRPIEVEASTLLGQIRALADDFQKACSFTITVLADSHRIRARRRLCRELLQIVRESLNNIRKHSDAAHAVITLEQSTDTLTLTVDDDGRGFNFEGRYDLEELDRLRLGPISIKQRVRAIGGQITLTSNPQDGSRLCVKVPLGTMPAQHDVAKLARSAGR